MEIQPFLGVRLIYKTIKKAVLKLPTRTNRFCEPSQEPDCGWCIAPQPYSFVGRNCGQERSNQWFTGCVSTHGQLMSKENHSMH
jgi:hypothetical protein